MHLPLIELANTLFDDLQCKGYRSVKSLHENPVEATHQSFYLLDGVFWVVGCGNVNDMLTLQCRRIPVFDMIVSTISLRGCSRLLNPDWGLRRMLRGLSFMLVWLSSPQVLFMIYRLLLRFTLFLVSPFLLLW